MKSLATVFLVSQSDELLKEMLRCDWYRDSTKNEIVEILKHRKKHQTN